MRDGHNARQCTRILTTGFGDLVLRTGLHVFTWLLGHEVNEFHDGYINITHIVSSMYCPWLLFLFGD